MLTDHIGRGGTQGLHGRPGIITASNNTPNLHSDGLNFQRLRDATIDSIVKGLHGLVVAADVKVFVWKIFGAPRLANISSIWSAVG